MVELSGGFGRRGILRLEISMLVDFYVLELFLLGSDRGEGMSYVRRCGGGRPIRRQGRVAMTCLS